MIFSSTTVLGMLQQKSGGPTQINVQPWIRREMSHISRSKLFEAMPSEWLRLWNSPPSSTEIEFIPTLKDSMISEQMYEPEVKVS